MDLPRVLAIDDDLQLLRALSRMVRKVLDVTIAPTVVEARKLLEQTSFDVILCDVRMPFMKGDEFVASLSPAIAERVVFMSGDECSVNKAPSHPTLLKPFTTAELLRAIACLCPAAA